MLSVMFRTRTLCRLPRTAGKQSQRTYSDMNTPSAKSFKVNSDRLWDDIHRTAQWSAPNATTEAGGLSRLSGTIEDKMARDWFREQVHSLGANSYTVNGTGSQFATFSGRNKSVAPIAMGSHLDSVATGGRFDGPLGVIGALEVVRSLQEQKIDTFAPICVINWTNEEGARFFPPLGSSCVFAGESTVGAAYESKANNRLRRQWAEYIRRVSTFSSLRNSCRASPRSGEGWETGRMGGRLAGHFYVRGNILWRGWS
jgi:hypothetical protein